MINTKYNGGRLVLGRKRMTTLEAERYHGQIKLILLPAL